MLWQIYRADNVCIRFYFATLSEVIETAALDGLMTGGGVALWSAEAASAASDRMTIAVEIFHLRTTRFINQISKEVPYKNFSIVFHFHKIVYENTLLWRRHISFEYQGYCKTRPRRSYCLFVNVQASL